jgi:signal transduction histidine kinase/ActR/RegA family two-component response regulator
VWTSDVLSEPGLEYHDEFRRAVASAKNRSVLVVPLFVKEDVIGVLAFTDNKVRTFSEDEVGLLQTFADQAALAIRNAQLFSDEQAARAKAATLAERLEVLHEIDQALISGEAPEAIAVKALLRLRGLLEAPRAIVSLFDLAAGEAEWLAAAGRRRVHLGPGVRFPLSLMGDMEALRRGELQVIDVASLPRSRPTGALLASGVSTYMVVPMIANGELLGGLSFGGEPTEFSAEQVSIAREVAAQLAIAVQQARLHERVKHHAEELTQRVQERTLELTGANEQLKREIADRERAEALADRANRAKSEFLSRMSHELRTPLNGIIGFGQLLQLDALAPEQRESVEHILKGGRHLLTLINEVLDIARIEAGKLSVSLEPVFSDEALRTALTLVRPQAAARMVRLREVVPCDCYVMADRQRLHQVLLNLLSNAVKYNREGGSIEVSCCKTALGRVRLAVSDTGHGISPAMLQRLYTPFDRLGGDELGVEGTGLGLALSKRLVEAMNGALVVESRLGAGTTFSVELAGAEAPWAVSVGPEDRAADTGTPTARGTVLYIEDNMANLRLVERIIGRRPELTLISAMQGSQGLELARSHRPQAIILDLHLADMPGGEVLARLREDSRTREIPVVILSADATPGQVTRLLAQGAQAYLTKPLDVAELLACLDNIFGGTGR